MPQKSLLAQLFYYLWKEFSRTFHEYCSPFTKGVITFLSIRVKGQGQGEVIYALEITVGSLSP